MLRALVTEKTQALRWGHWVNIASDCHHLLGIGILDPSSDPQPHLAYWFSGDCGPLES